MAREIKNAKIVSTSLGYEDHGILTAYLHLDYGGSGQGFGGYALDAYNDQLKVRVPTEGAGFFVQRVLEVVGVDSWEKLPGQYVRADSDWGRVYRLGSVLGEKWFDPEAEFRARTRTMEDPK